MLLQLIKNNIIEARKQKDSIKENILKLVISEASKTSKEPDDLLMYKALNGLFQANWDTITLLERRANPEDSQKINILKTENSIIDSYFNIKFTDIKKIIDSIITYPIEGKVLGSIMKTINTKYNNTYNKVLVAEYLNVLKTKKEVSI